MKKAKSFHRSLKNSRQFRYYSKANAETAIGDISHGCEIFCLTDGQFSLFDIISILLEKSGPADVIISTWTAAGADTKKAKLLLNNGNIRSIRWIVDRSFLSRQPDYCRILIEEFGDCIRSIRSHCKFVVITNDYWNLILRTSMNLNQNPRVEDFEISDDQEFADYFIKFTDNIFQSCDLDDNFKSLLNKVRLTGFDDQEFDGFDVSLDDLISPDTTLP
jgi:hypothetical protein